MAPISVYIAAEFLIFGQFKLNAKLVQQPLYGLAVDPAPNIKKLLLPAHLPMFHEFGLKPKSALAVAGFMPALPADFGTRWHQA